MYRRHVGTRVGKSSFIISCFIFFYNKIFLFLPNFSFIFFYYFYIINILKIKNFEFVTNIYFNNDKNKVIKYEHNFIGFGFGFIKIITSQLYS